MIEKSNRNALQKWIQLPVLIGIQQLRSSQSRKVKVRSLQYKININIKNGIQFSRFLKTNHGYAQFMCNYKVLPQNIKTIQVFSKKQQNLIDFDLSQRKNSGYCIYKKPQYLKNRERFNLSDSQTNRKYNYSYKIEAENQEILNKQNVSKRIKLKLSQQNIEFYFTKLILNIKFARNQILANLFSVQNTQTKGLLTMDKQNRFVLGKQNIPFPVVGFWLKSNQRINQVEVYQSFSEFIKRKVSKKCIFRAKEDSKLYFYFVKLANQMKESEVYLVSWTQKDPIQIQINYSQKQPYIKYPLDKKQSKSNQLLIQQRTKSNQFQNIQNQSTGNQNNKKSILETFKQNSLHREKTSNFQQLDCRTSSGIQSNQSSQKQNILQFTLRKNKRNSNQLSTLESLINYSYLSPIKQLDTPNEIEDNLFFNQFQNSPEFSTLTKKTQLETQCIELKNKVKQQQEELAKLKQVILEMQSQLKTYKNSRMSTNCESYREKSVLEAKNMLSPSELTLNSNISSGNSSPKDARRLRESDLKSNSATLSDFLKNSSSKKGLTSSKDQQSLIKRQNQEKSTQKKQYRNDYKLKELNLQVQNTKQIYKLQNRNQRLYNKLPQIAQEDSRLPWQYMQIIEQ